MRLRSNAPVAAVRGFVRRRGDRCWIDRNRKIGSIVGNEIILDAVKCDTLELTRRKAAGSILDVGAGDRPYSLVYEQGFKRCVSCDVETSPHDIDGVHVIASADDLPFSDGEFDFILCTEVLEHCRYPEKALSEMARVVRPGGRILLTTPFMVGLHEMPYDFFRYTPPAIAGMAVDAGLKVVSCEPRGDQIAVSLQLAIATVGFFWRAVSKLTGARLYRTWNPFVYVGVVLPQLAYLQYWRFVKCHPHSALARISRRLQGVTLGYVTRLEKPTVIAQ